MRWWLTIILVLLIHTNAIACNGCSSQNSLLRAVSPADPARYRVIYTGLKGLLIDEYVRAVSRKWSDDIERYYTNGAIDENGADAGYKLLNDYRQDYAANNYADKRKAWWHYLDDWGPIETYYTGKSGDVLDFGPFRVNNKFRFKFKEYEAKLGSKWDYKFRPIVRVTSKLPLIRSIATGHQFTYKRHGKKILRVLVAFGVDFMEREALAEAQLELLTW